MKTILLDIEYVNNNATNLKGSNGSSIRLEPAVEDAHCGRLMIRLANARIVILDYEYVPNEHDVELASSRVYITIPYGAGQKICTKKGCKRIGVPVLLYDSHPNDSETAYLKNGLCFTCQKDSNAKRRTKRKSNQNEQSNGTSAIVINAPVDGTRSHDADYCCPQISADLQRITSELSQETGSLVQLSSREHAMMPGSVDQQYQRAYLSATRAVFLLTQWKASYDQRQQDPQPQQQQPQEQVTEADATQNDKRDD